MLYCFQCSNAVMAITVCMLGLCKALHNQKDICCTALCWLTNKTELTVISCLLLQNIMLQAPSEMAFADVTC